MSKRFVHRPHSHGQWVQGAVCYHRPTKKQTVQLVSLIAVDLETSGWPPLCTSQSESFCFARRVEHGLQRKRVVKQLPHQALHPLVVTSCDRIGGGRTGINMPHGACHPPRGIVRMFTWWWWLFPRVRGFWENVRQFIPGLRFFFFSKVEISSCTLISLFRSGSVRSGSES